MKTKEAKVTHNRRLTEICFFNDGALHNMGGPAMMAYTPEGLLCQEFHVHGMNVKEEDFKSMRYLMHIVKVMDFPDITEKEWEEWDEWMSWHQE